MSDPIQVAAEIQHRAARPDLTVALRASAGSGKTKVLVDRFLRLCIEDGPGRAHPRAILAITFTRKAAVEIQERLLERARVLALAERADRVKHLTALFAGRPDPAPTPTEEAAAANLMETILEDVSGLNVGTIHSFCQLILNRFAAEAGLDPHFSVLENQDDLCEEALDELERVMAGDPELHAAAANVGSNPAGARKILRGIMYEQMRLGRWLATHARPGSNSGGSRLARLPDLLADLRAFLFPDLELDRDPEAGDFLLPLAAALEDFAGAGADAVAELIGSADMAVIKVPVLDKLRAGARDAAAQLRELAEGGPADAASFDAAVAAARGVFLTGSNKTRVYSQIKKDLELKERFNAAVDEQALVVLGLLHRLGYIRLYGMNRDLLSLALRLFDIYDGLKKRDRVVDFQDLEDMACRLMGDQGSVGALLYRLDDSLSHILLDEFQDTNFNQWDMLRPFVDEFLGTSPDDSARTLFFVGDVKQSIYGFRGAEPDIFSRACELLQQRDLPVMNLPTNFRSLGHVVGGVGCLFNVAPLAEALSPEEREHVQQGWARTEAPGEVLVLAPFAPPAAEDQPADGTDSRSGDQLAAAAAAALVRRLKEDPHARAWEGFGAHLTDRPRRWDDFLILSRTRTEISLYEQAFRDEGIPFVSTGRGMLASSREVQDILALLRWLLWPEDSAALATVLRSPIFRFDDKAFQELLAARDLFRPGDDGRFRTPHELWRALRKVGTGGPYERPARLLAGWLKHTGFETCHDLLRRIYREGDVLERYLAPGTERAARGEQARYNLLRLLDLALSPEIAGTPTVRQLADFIAAADARGGQDEGVLPHSGGEGRVRFMTIHGAKGLEAPVVLLVDADRRTGKESPQVRVRPDSPDTPLLFRVTKEYRDGFKLHDGVDWPSDPLQRASAAAADRDRTEEANLLYVAMTRARDSLVILGGDNRRGENFDSQLRQIQRGIADTACAEHFQTDDPPGLVRPPLPPAGGAAAAAASAGAGPVVKAWQPPPPRETMKVVTPSGEHPVDEDETTVLAAGNRAAADEADPTERGHRVHLLLQIGADCGALPPGDDTHHAEAAAVFADPDLAWVFHSAAVGGRGLSEVPVIHRRVPAGPEVVEERVTGVIDRLVVRPDRVDIVDYKTNRFGGDATVRNNLVRHYAPQLASYRDVFARLYPDRPVRTWLLFTEPGLPAGERLAEVPLP